MRAMRINAKKKECANAPIGPFTTFSHCVYGYNIRNELVCSRRDAEGAKVLEYQYQYSTNSPTPNSSTPTLITMSYDRMGRRVTKNAQRFVYKGYLQIANSELETLNSKLQTFIWDPTEPIATRPLMWKHELFTVFYTHDEKKSVSDIVSIKGDVKDCYQISEFYERISAKFCKKCEIEMLSCLLGQSPWLEGRIKNATGCSVLLFKWKVNPWFGNDFIDEILHASPPMWRKQIPSIGIPGIY